MRRLRPVREIVAVLDAVAERRETLSEAVLGSEYEIVRDERSGAEMGRRRARPIRCERSLADRNFEAVLRVDLTVEDRRSIVADALFLLHCRARGCGDHRSAD